MRLQRAAPGVWPVRSCQEHGQRPEDVEDAAQEVFLRLHTSIHQLRQPEAFDLWLYRLTMRGSYDYLRKRPRRREVRMSDLEEQQVDAVTAEANRQPLGDEQDRWRIIDYVDSLLAQLSASHRILILLREMEGLSMQELSAVCGVSVRAVKIRLFRARQLLRKVLNLDSGNCAPTFGCQCGMVGTRNVNGR